MKSSANLFIIGVYTVFSGTSVCLASSPFARPKRWRMPFDMSGSQKTASEQSSWPQKPPFKPEENNLDLSGRQVSDDHDSFAPTITIVGALQKILRSVGSTAAAISGLLKKDAKSIMRVSQSIVVDAFMITKSHLVSRTAGLLRGLGFVAARNAIFRFIGWKLFPLWTFHTFVSINAIIKAVVVGTSQIMYHYRKGVMMLNEAYDFCIFGNGVLNKCMAPVEVDKLRSMLKAFLNNVYHPLYQFWFKVIFLPQMFPSISSTHVVAVFDWLCLLSTLCQYSPDEGEIVWNEPDLCLMDKTLFFAGVSLSNAKFLLPLIEITGFWSFMFTYSIFRGLNFLTVSNMGFLHIKK